MTALNIRIRRKDFGDSRRPSAPPVIGPVDLDVSSGEFVCFVGSSGCGKTTLLNLVAGLDRNFEGEIRFDQPTQGVPRIGYVFQNPRLLPWRTVEENIALALPPGHDPREVSRLFEHLGLQNVLGIYPEHLSVGMSRRVALIRAFAIQPDLLLMDEPLVSLDPPTARRIRELIIQLWQERTHTVLYVTHDLNEAIELADRLVFLSSSPATIVGNVTVDIPRAQRNEHTIEAFKLHLHSEYPAITRLL